MPIYFGILWDLMVYNGILWEKKQKSTLKL